MTSQPETMSTTRSTVLRTSTHDFCTALISPPPPADLLSTYFTSNPQITEHGPSWSTTRLPFLHKTFDGTDGCVEYFTLLSDTLEMCLPADAFPERAGFVVDAEAEAGKGMVSVVGKGRFTSKKTGKAWDEQFIYRFSGFDAAGKIGWWEIWADPLSAWEAVGE